MAFKEFANAEKFNEWLVQQKVGRTINKLQVHHMYLPNYSTWKNTDCKIWSEKNAPLNRTASLDEYGKQKWKYSDGKGHYIAQHFSIFPNGVITTGRDLSSTPIGIKGWNTGAICVEIYGDFDKDVMTEAQRKSVLGLYYYLGKKFNIAIDTTHVRPHAWFTAGGTYLGAYSAGKSAKTCPGTKFFYGLTKTGWDKFLNDIKNYKSNGSNKTEPTTTTFSPYIVRVICDELNIRKGAGISYDKVGELHKGDAYTIIEEKNGWGKLKFDLGWISLGTKYVEKVKK